MIIAHLLIKNEENFVWYSVMSVIDNIDKIMIWDTGSTDNTKEIVKEIIKKYKDKIEYRETGEVDKTQYTKIRQQMVDETKFGWIFVLDGDEIWWSDSIKKVVNFINKKGNDFETIIVPTFNLVGDMFHYQEKSAGKYKFGNRVGHYALRFMNKDINGLHVSDEYGKEGYFDNENKPIQNRNQDKQKFINAPYIHTTHLMRSSKDKNVMQRNKKLKYEIGTEFPKDFYYPEVFFKEKPTMVSNIWKNTNFNFKLKAFVETPLRKIKRKLK
ncbi:hypothetical protein BH10PAT1_BH10PAT1_3030 [soil metagenome]